MNRVCIGMFALTMIGAAADAPGIFTGTITDSMCVMNHKMMSITPDAKCARECVRDGQTVKYVLHDGKNTYKLSDQKTPGQFAAQRVRITGALFPKTGVIKVDKIEPVK